MFEYGTEGHFRTPDVIFYKNINHKVKSNIYKHNFKLE